MREHRGEGYSYRLTLSLTSALEGGRWSTPSSSPGLVQEAGRVSGQVWTGAENLAPTGVRTPNRPARSESL